MNVVSTMIDELLADQQSLSAVERFSQKHERATGPVQEKYYRDLIPIEKPGSGEQYSFEVDLEACSGCKACVTACHSLNGLEDDESWRDVGVLYGGTVEAPIQQTVTTACHHCADPECANGCPTQAYEKDADTGIVRHLDDQCIGCQYCQLKCPYDVPKYSDRLGIVRKCDMCHSRLAEGEAPACVQACPNEAIRIRIVPTPTRLGLNGDSLVPSAPKSTFTVPTTVFLNSQPNLVPGDADSAEPDHAHWPLVVMLTLTQVGAGCLIAAVLGFGGLWLTFLAAGLIGAGLGGATLHLGQPLKAWKAFLGWRTSWLSREVMVFGPWAGASVVWAAASWLLPEFTLPMLPDTNLIPLLGYGAAAMGVAAVFTSVMVYADTPRAAWALPRTAFRFYSTVAIFATLWQWPLVAAGVALVKIGIEAWWLTSPSTETRKSVRQMMGPLQAWTILGFGFAIFGMVCALSGFIGGAAIMFFGAAFVERTLFFMASGAQAMPGGVFKKEGTH